MTSQEIYTLVSTYAGFDITKKNRKRVTIYYRGIANNLCKKHTRETFESIGSNYNGDHATVIHSLKKFKDDYIHQTDPIEVKVIHDALEAMILDSENLKLEELSEEAIRLANALKTIEEKDAKISKLRSRIFTLNSEMIKQRLELDKKANESVNEIEPIIKQLDPENMEWFIMRIKPIVRMQPKKFNPVSNI